MNSNNQSSIQISPQGKFFHSIRSYYTLCSQLLQINDEILRYFPISTQPFRQTFGRLISIYVKQRQTRQQLSLHLTSAYFYTSQFERQTYLQNSYLTYLSKLREVPVKIKLLLALDTLRKTIQHCLKQLQNQSNDSLQFDSDINSKIISPNEIIKQCSLCIKTIKQINETNFQVSDSPNVLIMKDKQELKKFYQQKQFSLDKNLSNTLLWKYEACILCSLLFLEKQVKRIAISFIKQTKLLLKSGILQLQMITKVYVFCLKNAIKKNTWIQNDEQHVYFQLQLKKITHQSKNQLSQKLNDQIQNLFKKIKNKAQHHLFQNSKNQQKSAFSTNANINKLFPINDFSFKKVQDQTERFKFKSPLIKSSSSHTVRFHNQFLPTNSSKFKFNIARQSESLRQIKQYQLSMRKQKQQEQAGNRAQNKKLTSRTSNQQNQHKKQRKSTFKLRNSKHASFMIEDKQKIKMEVQKIKQQQKQMNLKKDVIYRTPSKIYLSIKDKVNKQVAITSMGLQNQMFMAPEFVYQKPKITLGQILNDARSMQQRQNDTQSTVLHQTVNEIQLQKIQTQLQYLFMMNQQYFTFKIKKLAQCTEHFTCTIITTQFSYSRVRFEQAQFFTLKTIKNAIQSTDLFFQLMQASIKGFKQQPVLKLAMSMKNLSQLQNSDQLTYYSHMTCMNSMVQIANFIQPYIYWYFTKRNKLNGAILQKRQKLQMTDPLKFSINLQFFKKSDFAGCIQLFQTVRNKKGLKECIMYLSQGRQIICKNLVKVGNKYLIQVAELHPKYLKYFEIGEGMQLSFPVLKLYLKRYKPTQEIKDKNSLIIKDAIQKMFIRSTNKKKSKRQDKKQLINEQYEKINMRQIYSNEQCNRIIINNLNKNYIQRRLIQKLIKYINKRKQQDDIKNNILQQQSIELNNNRSKQINDGHMILDCLNNKQRVIYQKQDNNKLQSRFGLQSNPLEQQQITQALKHCLAKLCNKNIQYKQNKQFKQNIIHSQSITDDFIKKGYIISQQINIKLKNYHKYINYMVQNYEQSLLLSIRKQHIKKIKLSNRFYQLTVFEFYNNTYLLILRQNESSKTWVIYLSQKLLRNFDYLTFNTKSHQQMMKIQKQKIQKQNQIQQSNKNSIKININPALNSYDSINSFNNHTNSLSSNNLQEENNKINSLQQQNNLSSNISVKSIKSQQIYKQQKINYYQFPSIFNFQSSTFQLSFMKTPYYNSLAIKRINTDLYLTNLSSKSNPFSLAYNVHQNIVKQIIKIYPYKNQKHKHKKHNKNIPNKHNNYDKYQQQHKRLSSSHQKLSSKLLQNKAIFIFISCSYDSILQFWRIDIYNPSNQQKYVTFIDSWFLAQKPQTNSNLLIFDKQIKKYQLFWKQILNSQKYQINFQQKYFILNSNKFKLYQTFGQITLPSMQFLQESYFEKIKNKNRHLDQVALQNILKNIKNQGSLLCSIIRNSGLVQLLKIGQQVILVLFNYSRGVIYKSDIEQNPVHIFGNIFSQYLFKQSKHFMYQNLFRRLFQKIQKNSIVLNQTQIQQLNIFHQFQQI